MKHQDSSPDMIIRKVRRFPLGLLRVVRSLEHLKRFHFFQPNTTFR